MTTEMFAVIGTINGMIPSSASLHALFMIPSSDHDEVGMVISDGKRWGQTKKNDPYVNLPREKPHVTKPIMTLCCVREGIERSDEDLIHPLSSGGGVFWACSDSDPENHLDVTELLIKLSGTRSLSKSQTIKDQLLQKSLGQIWFVASKRKLMVLVGLESKHGVMMFRKDGGCMITTNSGCFSTLVNKSPQDSRRIEPGDLVLADSQSATIWKSEEREPRTFPFRRSRKK